VERLTRERLRVVGRELVQAGVAVLEEEELAKGGWLVDKTRRRDLLTVFGWMRLERRYMRQGESGRYGYLVEVGHRHRHATAAVVEQAVMLATRIPYRQATEVVGRLVGEAVDHHAVYQWVRAEGQQVIDEETARQEATFVDGLAPERDERQRELVVAVVDGTYIRAQREEQDHFEVRLGVAYSGRSLVSASAKYPRYRLEEREVYAAVATAQDFGERFYLACERRLGLSCAEHLLVIGDGADWIEALAGHERYRATYQLDHWHILDHARRTFGDRPGLVEEIARCLRTGEGERILWLVGLARLHAPPGGERIAAFEQYLRANQRGIHGARRLRRQLSAQARLAAVNGSGAVEKHGDLVVARRFEHAGMRWTRAGAHCLLKLRLRELQRAG
jgi:hypothetical protein